MKSLLRMPESAARNAIIFLVLGPLLLTQARASAGLPSVVFSADIKAPFFEATAGDSDTIYAIYALGTPIAHLDKNGRVLTDFSAALDASSPVSHVARDSSGNLFITGGLKAAGTAMATNVMKLQPSGAVAGGFAPVFVANSKAENPLDSMSIAALAADGMGGCWIGSSFDLINGVAADGLAHIDSSGRVAVVGRLHPHQEGVIFLARAADGMIVIEPSSIYEILDAGGMKVIDVAGARWTRVLAATFSPQFGLAIAATTQTITRCFVFQADGNPASSFQLVVGFVRGPNQIVWDRNGRLLVCSAQLADFQGSPVPDAVGVKRLLSNGSLDGSWNQAIDFQGGLEIALPLSDSVIVSGTFQSISGNPTESVVKLSGEDVNSRLVGQSTLGWVKGGSQQMIMGVAIGGEFMVQALVRVSGPSLAQFGVTVTPSQTRCQVFRGQQALYSFNPGRDSNTRPYIEPGAIKAATLAVGEFPLGTLGFDEAEGLVTLVPGVYTIVADAPSGQSGQVLAEIYYP